MRSCGACQTCCVVAEVIEGNLDKPAGHRCVHQCSAGCAIHADPFRPKVCGSFQCAWMRGVGADEDRPDLSGLLVSVSRTPGGVIGMAVELEPDAVLGKATAFIAAFVTTADMPLVIVSHGRTAPDDTGDLLALRKRHVLRAFAMRGPLVRQLSDDAFLYEFARRAA